MQKIGMKQQSDSFRCGAVFRAMDTYGLPRSKTYDGLIVEIIDGLTIIRDCRKKNKTL